MRVAGSGHSFTPVVATSGLLLSLKNMQGSSAPTGAQARHRARGHEDRRYWPRSETDRAVARNQGDIDTQAIAGALSTGTHGTGIKLGYLSSQAVGMRLVQPDGSVLDIDVDRDPETMAAAQVSVGMLGVISTVTLQAVAAYNLKEKLWRDDFEACMEKHDELAANNRHFSFFWCPGRRIPASLLPAGRRRRLDRQARARRLRDEGDERHRRAALCERETFERVAYSSEIYPIEYVPNFHELEYAIPVENGKDALRQVRELMLTKHTNCIYPVEYRFVAGDPGMLSPYYQRASVTVSVSGGPGVDYWAYLLDVDAILRQYGARPHWGKLHFNTAEDMPALYPRFHDFQAIRRRLDPSGLFLNDHLRNLFA